MNFPYVIDLLFLIVLAGKFLKKNQMKIEREVQQMGGPLNLSFLLRTKGMGEIFTVKQRGICLLVNNFTPI